jgi:type I restriction-modification system DNA methylase subunit
VSKTIKKYDDRVLDPACGSGTFLVAALKRKVDLVRSQNKNITNNLLLELINEIFGIDINPLSVMCYVTSKTSPLCNS